MTSGSYLLLLLVLPFIGSLVSVFLLQTRSRALPAWLAGIVTFASFAIIVFFYPSVENGGVVRYEYEWLPQLGLNLSLRMDGFAWLFSALITGIGLLVVV